MFADELLEGLKVHRVWVRTTPVKTSVTRLLFYLSFLVMATLRGWALPGPVHLVVASSPPLPVGLAGWLIARRHRARFVLDVRDLWPAAAVALGELRNPLFLRLATLLERFLYAQADCITTVTRSFIQAIRRTAPAGKTIEYVPNGAATEIFQPGEADPRVRAELAPNGGFIATFAGNLGIAQGLDALLRAAKILENDGVVVCLIGDGPAKAGLETVARSLGLRNVTFLPAVPTSQILPFLLASDVLLVTLSKAAVFEMFVPSKLFDSLACARPVILMAKGEASDILESSGGGVSVAPEDAEGLAEAIRTQASAPPSDRERMGKRGHDYVVANFTRATQNRRMVALICQVATKDR